VSAGSYRAFDERQAGWMKVELVPGLELVDVSDEG
jgi:hypothetical protein